jgi:3-hydroxyisobutyrate dehydrogenase-like beta-hydroxyacid dehydrogenase
MQMGKIAIIGTGRLGTAIARALLASGHEVSVWNRTPSRAQPLVERGARLAGSVRDAVSAAELSVAILSDYRASEQQLHAADVASALRGKTLLQFASGSPSDARSAAAWARERGVRYLDGAVMATPSYIGKAEGTILYAGERELFDENESILSCLAGTSVYVGADPGQAAALDSALLVYMWGVLFGALHGVAIGQAEGIALEAYLAYAKGMLPMAGAMTVELIERTIERDYEATEATLDAHYGALRHVLEICRQRGLDRTIPDAFDSVMKRGHESGLGELDFTALVKLIAPAAARP